MDASSSGIVQTVLGMHVSICLGWIGAFDAPALAQEPDSLRVPWIQRAAHLSSDTPLTIHTDLPPEVSHQLADIVHETRSAFVGVLPDSSSRSLDRSVLLLFASAGERDLTVRSQFIAPGLRRHGPAWLFSHDWDHYLALSTEHPSRMVIHRALRRAALEQLLLTRIGDQAPPWLQEGLIEYAGALHRVDSRLLAGEPPSDFVSCLHNLEKTEDLLTLDHLQGISSEQWNQPGQDAGNLAMRAQAWAAVHFLLHHPDGGGGNTIQQLIIALSDRSQAIPLLDTASLVDSDVESAYRSHVRDLEVGPTTRLREIGEQVRIFLADLESRGIRITSSNELRTSFAAELNVLADRIRELPGAGDRLAMGSLPRTLKITLKPSDAPRGEPAPPVGIILEQPDAGLVEITWRFAPSSNAEQAHWQPVIDW